MGITLTICDGCGTGLSSDCSSWSCTVCDNFYLCRHCKDEDVQISYVNGLEVHHSSQHPLITRLPIGDGEEGDESNRALSSSLALSFYSIFLSQDLARQQVIEEIWKKYSAQVHLSLPMLMLKIQTLPLTFLAFVNFFSNLEDSLVRICSISENKKLFYWDNILPETSEV
eukprot:TRINITY_DN5790_c0_g1_i2.p1 TRINITY_DN5790_c0_g1~~TRINITY_DN5790_c0_g1_i2.p1  ORF type:complete len:170 (-),score=26.62 TRINITY_DN5790_c0_g1_i2:587-1096(-)